VKPLSFAAIAAACPAALTEKTRKTTGDDYVTVPTRTLFNMVKAAGFDAFDCLQGPSVKPSYAPFARHMVKFRHVSVKDDATEPHFCIVMTNSHDGLTPVLFAPGIHYPAINATLLSTAAVVFHRIFTDETKHKAAMKAALNVALEAEAATLAIWAKAGRFSMTDKDAAGFVGRIVRQHSGATMTIPYKEVKAHMDACGLKLNLADVAAGFVSGFLNGKLKAPTPGRAMRAVYVPRAIIRHERPSFGAWYEMVRVLNLSGAKLPALRPFSVSPVQRKPGKGRRASGSVIVTDTPATLAEVAG